MQMDDLYQEMIIDHYKHPRHAAKLRDEEVLVDEENPTCGDRIRLTAAMAEDGTVAEIRYDANGCAISVASASMMAEALVGMPADQARAKIRDFVELMRGRKEIDAEDLGDLVALEGVKNFPMRIKCATMCWHAVAHALDRLTTA